MQLYYRLLIYEKNQQGTISHLDEISSERR